MQTLTKKAVSLIISSLFFLSLTPTTLAEEEPQEEIIYPQNSPLCTDFEILYQNKYSTQIETWSGVQSAEGKIEKLQGETYLNQAAIPDFSSMEQDLNSPLEKLLPQELKEKLKIKTQKLSSETKHFVLGKDDSGQEIIPQKLDPAVTTLTLPEWWSKLLGQTKVLCGLFGTCEAPKSLNIKINSAPSQIKENAYLNRCGTIGNSAQETSPEVANIKPDFKTESFLERIKRIIDQIIDKTRQIFARIEETEEKTTIVQKTRGEIPGGKGFQTFSDFQRINIPQEFTDEWEYKTGASVNSSQVDDIIMGKTLPSNPNLYAQEMEKERFKRCMFLCSLYPSDLNIQTIDPLCTSCDPKDYKIDYIEVDKTNCHWENSGCNYYTCKLGEKYQDPITKEIKECQPVCNGDPTCESELCFHNSYRQSFEYTSKGCSTPYSANNCNLKEICVPMTFKPNPNGGFGPCQYQNPNVCVRADWQETGVARCDYLCNWSCCAYQNK